MKIQCDVCHNEEASVFCSADEAALCDACDRGVHHANKLANKHLRFSLLHPSFKDSPLCDICQERRAFLFCQEDRAILCRECDIPIHKANEHTQKHNRFLLTGVKLSAFSSSYPASSSSNGCDVATDSMAKSSVSNQFYNPISSTNDKAFPTTPTPCNVDDHCISQEGSVSTSSISEYLMETLPGWHVEDFLDPSCSSHGFCKTYDHDLDGYLYPCLSKDLTSWVPQGPQSSELPMFLLQSSEINGLKGSEKANNVMMKVSRKWSGDGFTVPQISPPSLKRSRQFW
ncbi:hypothetical protein F0562_028533 [Nyssa sinensis]|uniref:B box-type domain-containing protein n=1 Tax=Nyssa sinensis TaxID=561372 RepID=A0A5J5AY95_9ASTE|nr:hypothetical protein F0562_028533 [Nyssa sinensis]